MSDGPVGVIFNVDEESVINGVDFIFKRFQRWNDPVVAENTDGGRTAVPREGAVIQAISEQTIDLLTPKDLKIEGFRGDTSVYGDRTLTYDVPGMLWQTDDDGDTLRSFENGLADDYVKPAGEVIIDRRGWGAVRGELEVFDDVEGEPLDYIDLNVPHQVNALVGQSPVAQRGGTRKVQIVGATPKAGTRMLYLEDAGNLAQTLPEVPDPPSEATIPIPTFDLTASVDAPTTIATATLTNDTDLEDYGVDGVEWQYAVQDTEPVGDGTPFGPLALSFGEDAIDTPAAPAGSKVWVRARSAVAATGERSDWSAWQSIELDTETGDARIDLSLSYTVDPDTGVVDVHASTNGTSVKFALADDGEPEATDAAVRAATADSSVPFEALDIVTLDEGDVRHVSAFAYDDLGNESIKVTIAITRPIDTGSAAGTPGNFTRTLHTTPTAVCRNVGAAFAEPEEAIPARFYANSSKWGSARLQLGSHRIATPGATVPLLYTLVEDPGPGDWIESGIFVRADRVKFPEPGAFAAPVAGAKGDNRLFTWGTKGGDGSTVMEVGNIYLEATVGLAPPASPEPPDGDLPDDMGELILDLNALTLLALGRADGSPINTGAMWPDDSGHVPDAKPYPGTMLQASPVFKTAGFPGGLPSVRVAGGNQGVYTLKPTSDEFTLYFVIGNLAGAGTNGDEQDPNAPIVQTQGGAASNFWLSLDEDGAIQSAVNTSTIGGFTGTLGSGGPYDGAATKHIIRMAWKRSLRDWYVYVDGTLDTFRSDPPVSIGNLMTLVSRWFFGNFSTNPHKLSGDYGRVLCYNQAHTTAGLNSVETALKAVWGTP